MKIIYLFVLLIIASVQAALLNKQGVIPGTSIKTSVPLTKKQKAYLHNLKKASVVIGPHKGVFYFKLGKQYGTVQRDFELC